MACRYFSAPQMATPPQSPIFSPVCDSPRSPISDDGSVISDDSDCSLVSDEGSLDSDFESSISDDDSLSAPASPTSDCDSGYDSMSDEAFEVISAPHVQRPQAPFTKQQYVLPQQEFPYHGAIPTQKTMSPYVAPSPWLHAWFSNGYPYGQAQPAPQVYHPAPYAHHPYSPFQHARDSYYY
jgi:hypothetical protein